MPRRYRIQTTEDIARAYRMGSPVNNTGFKESRTNIKHYTPSFQYVRKCKGSFNNIMSVCLLEFVEKLNLGILIPPDG